MSYTDIGIFKTGGSGTWDGPMFGTNDTMGG
jgi:hypothetical protein